MKIIDAYWELDNLDCRVAEVEIQDEVDFDENLLREKESLYDYIVIKIDSNDFRLFEKVNRMGYHFAETQLCLQKNINKFDISSDKLVQYHLRHFQIEQLSSIQQLETCLASMTPNMYHTDRIYLDPYFGPQYSLRRYKNWSLSEFKKGSPCFRMMYQDNCAGFAVLKPDGEVVNGLLAGFFEKYQNIGLGIMIPTLPLIYKNSNYWLYKTNVSSNNLSVIQMYLHHKYTVSKFIYVFVKHINK